MKTRDSKKKLWTLWPLLFLTAGCILLLFFYSQPVSYDNDVTAYNRLAKEAAENWDLLEDADYPDIGYPFSIISLDGAVLYHSSENTPVSFSTALRKGNPIIDIERNGTVAGKLIISKNAVEQSLNIRKRAACIVLIFLVCSTLFSLLYDGYLNRRVLKPLYNMERFAAEVSRGNLDYTLPADKNNLYGSFTQSFDRMREQLLLAREQEAQARKAQKELIASLSHDIKTPVTSIKITSEFLLETVSDRSIGEKLAMINRKAEQIEDLVNNLFHTTLQDMEHLTVSPVEIYSTALAGMIKDTDYRGKVMLSSLPDCMLWVDPLRLTQVLSNIITNSYKYADTEIAVKACLTDTHLKLSLRDFGNTVSEEELPFLFNKFYRGKNAAGLSGSGLGLYICKKLLEQMQGDIYCTCSSEGFCVVMMLKLA